MKKLSPALAAASLIAAGALAGSSSGAAVHAAGVKHVTIADDFFTPTTVKIKHGGTVVWKWTGSDQHNVHDGKHHISSAFKTSGTFRHRFKKRGTYSFICEVHPQIMRMKVVVK
jgi:plastocyanin